MRNILVTGASGFIGRSLLPLLQEKGFFIRASSRVAVDLKNQVNSNSVEWIQFDLRDPDVDYTGLLNNIHCVIHLAGRAHVLADPMAVPNDYLNINVEGTARLARAAAEKGIDRFIFLSTAKVYGDGSGFNKGSKIQRVTEDDEPSPGDAYAQSKLEAERAIYDVCTNSSMSYVILRPPLVFGPHVKANFLHLLDAVYRGYPLPLASIDNLRSFIYAGNLSHAILDCLVKAEAANHLFLVSDSELSTPELIRKIARSLERRVNIFPVPVQLLKFVGILTGKNYQVMRLTESLVIDSTKIREHLNWEPPYSLDEGLKATADWYNTRILNRQSKCS